MVNAKNIIYVVLLIVSSLSIKCQSTQQITSNPNIILEPSLASFTKDLFNIIILDNLSNLPQYTPITDIMRSIAPNETKGLSNTEIQKKLASLNERFLENAEKIRENIKDSGLILKNTNYIGYKIHPDSKQGSIEVLSIEIMNQNKIGMLTITYSVLNNQFYVFEILKSTGIFDNN